MVVVDPNTLEKRHLILAIYEQEEDTKGLVVKENCHRKTFWTVRDSHKGMDAEE